MFCMTLGFSSCASGCPGEQDWDSLLHFIPGVISREIIGNQFECEGEARRTSSGYYMNRFLVFLHQNVGPGPVVPVAAVKALAG